jgi:hypothetical protein
MLLEYLQINVLQTPLGELSNCDAGHSFQWAKVVFKTVTRLTERFYNTHQLRCKSI